MQNKYVVLCGVYRFDSSYLRGNIAQSVIAKDFLETYWTFNNANLASLAESISINYDVIDFDSMVAIINELASTSYVAEPLFHILMNAYTHDAALLKAKSRDILTRYATDAAIEQAVRRFNNGEIPTYEDEEGSQKAAIDDVKTAIQAFINGEESNITDFIVVLDSMPQLVPIAQQGALYGFQLSRIVEIITKCHNLGYINDETAEQALNIYGGIAEQLFDSWESFWASAVLGKVTVMGNVEGSYIKLSASYINGVYGLMISPLAPLSLSELWQGSKYATLSQALEQHIDKQAIGKGVAEYEQFISSLTNIWGKCGLDLSLINQSIDLADKLIFSKVREAHVDYFMYQGNEAMKIKFAYDEFEHPGHFTDAIETLYKKHKVRLEAGEIPIFTTGNYLFTNLRIYRRKKSLFSSSLEIIEWSDVTFEVAPISTGHLKLKMNDKTIQEWTLEASYFGMKDDMDLLEKGSGWLRNKMKHEISTINDIFNGLKNNRA